MIAASPRPRRRAAWPSGPLLVAALCAGCGTRPPATAPVTGRVLLDGQPLAAAAVLFEPVEGGVPARGSTGPDGTFTLNTFARGDGALLGRHRVAVSKVVVEGVAVDATGLEAGPPEGPVRERVVVPLRYGVPATSGLDATVAAPATTVEFTLESR